MVKRSAKWVLYFKMYYTRVDDFALGYFNNNHKRRIHVTECYEIKKLAASSNSRGISILFDL